MKQRVISGAACVVVLAAVLFMYQTLVLEAAMSVLSSIAVFELLSATGFREHKPFLFLSVVTAFVIPYASIFHLELAVAVAFLVISVLLMLKFHEKIEFDKISFTIVSTLFVSFSFLCIVLLGRMEKIGLVLILLAFGGAWFADTGAFFVGKFFGKHKLAPKISPKKTVEGAIGGFVSNVLLTDLMVYVYSLILMQNGEQIAVKYFELSVIALAVAFAGMLGDLTASVIKRQTGIKDYGKIIPGHGGIMDRFDSILFTAPIVYILSLVVSVIK